MAALAWHETRAFSPDGRRLYFVSDRGAGMGNLSVHYFDLKSGKRNRVTYDEGFAEGAVLAPDNEALYSGITRARDPAFMTMVGGPAVPPFLGFAATPALHDELAERKLTLIGNGDVLAVDPTFGLHGRVVGNRRAIAKKLNEPVRRGTYRVIACSMSPDGTELAAAAISEVGQHVVLLRRRPRSVPPLVRARRTRTPPGSAPLSSQPVPNVNRTISSRNGGRVTLNLDGDLAAGSFQMALDNFSADGVHVFAGTALFETGSGGAFRHAADVRRVGVESQEDTLSFYNADMRVAWRGADGRHDREPLACRRPVGGLGRDPVRRPGRLADRRPGAAARSRRRALRAGVPALADHDRRARMQVRRAIGMNGVREDLEPVHEARRRPREVRRRVHGDDALRAEGGKPVVVVEGLVGRLAHAQPARHDHDHLGRDRGHLVPGRRARLLTGKAEQVDAARDLDQLWDPVPADERRGKPLERRDRARACALEPPPDRVDPVRGVVEQLVRRTLVVGGVREAAHVGQHLAERQRVE